jgi:hypothetical protein
MKTYGNIILMTAICIVIFWENLAENRFWSVSAWGWDARLH